MRNYTSDIKSQLHHLNEADEGDYEEDDDYEETDGLYCDVHRRTSSGVPSGRGCDAGSPPDYDDVAVSSSGNEEGGGGGCHTMYHALPMAPPAPHLLHCCSSAPKRRSIVMNPADVDKDVMFADRVSPEGNNDSDGVAYGGNRLVFWCTLVSTQQ